MSCWVVPTVAAELWGVAVDTILDRARSGVVPSKTENGFMFVDVAPNSTRCDPPKGIRPPSPPTFTVVTEVKASALRIANDTNDANDTAEPVQQPVTLDDWRTGRVLASRTRKPPKFG
ncbi:MAG: hypothetical protein H7Z14_15530 [Anaerolineae bacterium]|nr:hypothetical protein [Phycisphaerae bacterium]